MSLAFGTLLQLIRLNLYRQVSQMWLQQNHVRTPLPHTPHIQLNFNHSNQWCHSSSLTWLFRLRGLSLDVGHGGVEENESKLDRSPNFPRWQCWFSTLVSSAAQGTPLQQDIIGNNMLVLQPVQRGSDSRDTGNHYRKSGGFMAYLEKSEGCLLLQNCLLVKWTEVKEIWMWSKDCQCSFRQIRMMYKKKNVRKAADTRKRCQTSQTFLQMLQFGRLWTFRLETAPSSGSVYLWLVQAELTVIRHLSCTLCSLSIAPYNKGQSLRSSITSIFKSLGLLILQGQGQIKNDKTRRMIRLKTIYEKVKARWTSSPSDPAGSLHHQQNNI